MVYITWTQPPGLYKALILREYKQSQTDTARQLTICISLKKTKKKRTWDAPCFESTRILQLWRSEFNLNVHIFWARPRLHGRRHRPAKVSFLLQRRGLQALWSTDADRGNQSSATFQVCWPNWIICAVSLFSLATRLCKWSRDSNVNVLAPGPFTVLRHQSIIPKTMTREALHGPVLRGRQHTPCSGTKWPKRKRKREMEPMFDSPLRGPCLNQTGAHLQETLMVQK